jgi:hypothetical protein
MPVDENEMFAGRTIKGGIRKRGEPTTPADSGSSGKKTPLPGRIHKKNGEETPIPEDEEDEDLDDSDPIDTEELADGGKDIFQSIGIGGFSLSTILLIVLMGTVGFLLIKRKG